MKKYISEMIFTFIFVLVVLGVTDDKKGTPVMCGLAIGLTLVLVHIVCIPITGTSVNPARSIGPALFEGGCIDTVMVVYCRSFCRCCFIGCRVEEYRQRKITIRILSFLSGTGLPLFG